MKKYLIKIALFFTIIAVVDFAFGKLCDYLRDHTKGGFSGNVHYICEQCNEDIIMMGSSRMKRHYVPQVFEDSLGMTCYNAGINGNGIILSYGFLEMILQRYTPKLIIYDVSRFDFYKDDNTKYLGELRAYYHKKGIPAIFYDVDSYEKWKMKSGMFRYNSSLLGLMGDNLHPTHIFDKGYWPSNKQMNYEPEEPQESSASVVDELKIDYLHKFIALAREHDIPIIFILSPTWFGEMQRHTYDPIRKVCIEDNVVIIDKNYDDLICSTKEYWADATHLNEKGAYLFSKRIQGEIVKVLQNINGIR